MTIFFSFFKLIKNSKTSKLKKIVLVVKLANQGFNSKEFRLHVLSFCQATNRQV